MLLSLTTLKSLILISLTGALTATFFSSSYVFAFFATNVEFSFISKNCSNKIPQATKLSELDNKLIEKLKDDTSKLIKLMNNQNLNEFIKSVVGYSFDANKYFNDSEPWSLKKKDPVKMNNILFTVCEQIKNISILLIPIIPISANKVLDTMNVNLKNRSIADIQNKNCFDSNEEIKKLDILFNKIENDN